LVFQSRKSAKQRYYDGERTYTGSTHGVMLGLDIAGRDVLCITRSLRHLKKRKRSIKPVPQTEPPTYVRTVAAILIEKSRVVEKFVEFQ
jgi:hypothetical protein